VKPVKIMQTGDLHLDMPFSGGSLPYEKAQKRRQDLKDNFLHILQLARDKEADLLLITGDLFEHQYVDRATISFIDQQFARCSDMRIFISPGNHDPALKNSYYRTYPWKSPVHIFCEKSIDRVPIPSLETDIHGFGWDQWQLFENPLSQYRASDTKRLNIFMGHGEVNVGEQQGAYCPLRVEEVEAAGGDYLAAGHVHRYKTYESQGRVIAQYAGSPEPLHFGETGDHGVLFGQLSKSESKWEFIKTQRKRYEVLAVPAETVSDSEQLSSLLEEKEIELDEKLLIRLVLEGAYDPDAPPSSRELKTRLKESCFFAEVKDNSRPDYDLKQMQKEYANTLIGDFIDKMLERIEGAVLKEEKERLTQSLYIGLDALTGRRRDLV